MVEEKKALFIIFGATGDLAKRKLYPSLYRLFKEGYLHEHFAVIGTARREWSNAHYEEVVRASIADIQVSEESARLFSSHFRYQSHDVTNRDQYTQLKKASDQLDSEYNLGGNRLFYFAMSPSFFGMIAAYIKSEHLFSDTGFNRVVVEKPFGQDYESAVTLNKDIRCSFEENQIYRIDHYLGKEMVQTILPMRLSNPLLGSIWNHHFIDNIQVTLSESLGVEERGGFYDHTGALKDMVQNHILQLIALLAMEPPATMDAEAIRHEKITVLNALTPVSGAKAVRQNFIRGQYAANEALELRAYRQEDQVDSTSTTETFVAGKITIDTERWTGVPFYIRTGKRLQSKTARVDIVFKKDAHCLYVKEGCPQNVLTLHLDPKQGWTFQMTTKEIGPGLSLHSEKLTHYISDKEQAHVPEAYEKLFLDSLNGDPTNFAHWEEVAASWKYVDPIRRVWDEESVELPMYPSRSMGPLPSIELLKQDGREWIWTGKSEQE